MLFFCLRVTSQFLYENLCKSINDKLLLNWKVRLCRICSQTTNRWRTNRVLLLRTRRSSKHVDARVIVTPQILKILISMKKWTLKKICATVSPRKFHGLIRALSVIEIEPFSFRFEGYWFVFRQWTCQQLFDISRIICLTDAVESSLSPVSWMRQWHLAPSSAVPNRCTIEL